METNDIVNIIDTENVTSSDDAPVITKGHDARRRRREVEESDDGDAIALSGKNALTTAA